MTTSLVGVPLGGTAHAPLLLLGPSLGTSAATLWGHAATDLARSFHVVGWDLPGHGRHRGADSASEEPFTIADLAAGVIEIAQVYSPDRPFHYAGDSVGGAVGLQLLLDAPERVASATTLCTGARLGTEEMWRERAASVRASGTASMVSGSAERWFAPGFLDREPTAGSALLHALRDTDDEGYARVCEALATFDVRERLHEITTPVLAVAGGHDGPTPPALLREVADGVQDGRLVVLDDVAHLAPVEAPARVAQLMTDHAGGHRD
ncbi:alpha/beta fold hydrolase [Aeromicrobium sp. CTD01-1L150]|uniref:alpha/beta fold hydrolase n=1 Tax=Aeromicrobium sp. CTD01-1L150 TaxID=3341830 RepID=UPI0035C16163